MWVLNNAFVKSYGILCLASFICLGHPWIQRLLVFVWMVHMARICYGSRRDGVRLVHLLWLVCASQLPGIVLILFSGWSIETGKWTEWPSGFMEVWYHPFIPLLEMLPPGHVGPWSDMYLATCLVPAGVIAACCGCWMIAGKLKSPLQLNP